MQKTRNTKTGTRYLYRPQTKLREGIVFTPVCDSVHRGGAGGGGVNSGGQALGGGVCMAKGMHGRKHVCGGGGCAGEMATDASGTHPTGMHSCPRSLHFVVHCFYCN